MNYRFDVSSFTIGDSAAVVRAAQANDVYALLEIANRFIPINLFTLPMAELPIVIQDFVQALSTVQSSADPIDQLIQRALEDRT